MADLWSYEDALAALLGAAPVPRPERVRRSAALGRVLATPVASDRDQPPFDRAAMDGFAVRAADGGPELERPVTGEVPAGAPPGALSAGAATRIATGAAVPEGADAVVPVERAAVTETAHHEHVRFRAERIEPGQNIHPRGADAAARGEALAAGTVLGPAQLAIAATVGAEALPVARRPRIALLTTGDELKPPGTTALADHEIRNSNGPMLEAFLASLGVPVAWHEHVPDEAEATRAAAERAAADAELVVTVGGVSAGDRDWLPWAWGELGLETLVRGVAVKPGKPLIALRGGGTLVVGLPGNPVSVLVTAALFLWPLLRRGQGLAPALPWRDTVLHAPVRAQAKRAVFRPGRLAADGSAEVLAWQGSGDLLHTARAGGLVALPRRDGELAAGEAVRWLGLPGGPGA